ncbi:ATP12 family chaperone protein [Phenylobacterium sp.]|uniref:ATP12 family chaperone protein n=1 Tax=Phenylobacterium sp. TaxID=1871053 RepID=UPI0035B2ADB8
MVSKGFHEPVDKPKRFYKEVAVEPEGAGFAVKLDGRTVRTPKGGKLVAPTRALADLVAAEWAAQTDVIELATMHATRLANTALEALPSARQATAQSVVQYAASDLICYFADEPQTLAERQALHWEPVLARAEAEIASAFVRASGIIHREQPAETLERVRELAEALDDFRLTGLAFGAALFGSAILALGVLRGWLSGEQAFELSRLDEAYQEEKWGVDAEAAERTARLMDEARLLDRWFRALDAG